MSIERKLSDYLHIKMLLIDVWGSIKETCVQRSPGHFPWVTIIYRFDCNMIEQIEETTVSSYLVYIAFAALALSVVNLIVFCVVAVSSGVLAITLPMSFHHR